MPAGRRDTGQVHSGPAIPSLHPRCASPLLQGGAGAKGMGVSIVDALSTLKLMGLDREFDE